MSEKQLHEGSQGSVNDAWQAFQDAPARLDSPKRSINGFQRGERYHFGIRHALCSVPVPPAQSPKVPAKEKRTSWIMLFHSDGFDRSLNIDSWNLCFSICQVFFHRHLDVPWS